MEKAELRTALTKLTAEQKAIRSMLLMKIVMLVLLVVLLFTVGIKAVYAAGAVVLVYNLLFIRPAKKRYLENLSRTEALCGTGGSLTECSYEPKGTLEKDALQQYKLVSPRAWPVEAICRHKLSGSYAGARVELCECSFTLKHGARNGDVDFISGSFIQALLPKDSGLHISCMTRDIKHISDELPRLEEYGLEPVAFNGKKTNELAFAFTDGSHIPEWLESRFSRLCAAGGALLLSLDGDRLAIFAIGRFYAPKHKLSDMLSGDALGANRLPERDAALELIRIIQQKC